MKKIKLLFLILALGILMIAPAQADNQFVDSPNITVAVDGKLVSFPDQPPVIDMSASRTLVPVRFPAETLGAEVGWNQATQQVTIDQAAHDKLPESHLILTLNNRAIKVNGENKQMDTTPVVRNQRTLVPIRFISEYLGAKVEWYTDSSTVHVFTQGQTAEQILKIEQDVAKQLGKTPINTDRTIGPNDSMFTISFRPQNAGTNSNVVDINNRDRFVGYRWVCTSHEGMNTYHTFKYPSGEPAVMELGKEAGISFSIDGSGYDTPVVAGMKLTYNIYDTSDNLVRIVDFQL